jgi:phenylpropionate dioxygenase-like ring-hydroxylating dioxygenase large terminal subunit
MTPKTSRYFFSWGPRRDCGDETLRDTLMGIAAKAFAEDRAMIESQQKIIDATPNPKVMPTKADRGATMFNNMVAKQLREEAALAQPS